MIHSTMVRSGDVGLISSGSTIEHGCNQAGARGATHFPHKWISARLLALAICTACAPATANAVEAVPIGTFTDPVYVAAAPGYRHLLFIVERPGQIQVLLDEVKLPEPFLDIRDLVLALPDPDSVDEQGLLSLAFAPDYADSGLFYVYFTNNDGAIEIDEFQRSPQSATLADPATRRVLLVIPPPGSGNHNGGHLQFGPDDGLLYISTGDGDTNPPGRDAPKLKSLVGKILRIDPRPHGSRPYRIPPDNPFVGQVGRDQIFAYGLRNPWRFSFDRGRMALSDVGQQSREEVNFLATGDVAGVNFGWPQYEGELVFDPTRPGPHPAAFPMFTYDHSSGRCAVIGGYVVRDPNLPTLKDRYLYGDFCTGELRSFIPKVRAQKAIDDQPIGVTLLPFSLSSFGKGSRGQIYVTQTNGMVSRLSP